MSWPALPLESWRDTRDTLQMWMQIAGKICLARTPRVNHFWNVTFQLTPRGLTTYPMPHGDRTFTMAFDFIAHELVIETSDGAREPIPLKPQTVADFYKTTMETLRTMGLETRIWTMPVEFPDPIRFEQDVTHRSYDPDAVRRCHDALLTMKPVFDAFRAEFIGKCSPLHLFWGGFDLALTRFSGRRAPERPDADAVTRESYSHEVISHGWWPGSGVVNYPAFYAYAAPEPEGFKTAPILPAAAFYSSEMSIYVLPHEAVRTSATPEADVRAFLRTTYDAGATLGHWDRASLERAAP